MIKKEILDLAEALDIDPHVIENDYVLGWLLWGTNSHKAIDDSWLFKGGTCLKICFFKTYRFSDNVDFTIVDSSHIDGDFLLSVLAEIGNRIFARIGNVMPEEMQKVKITKSHMVTNHVPPELHIRVRCHLGSETCRVSSSISHIEEIRFAATNWLCVDLEIQGSAQRTEPYSLRRDSEANFSFMLTI